jgi:hypothetical protein
VQRSGGFRQRALDRQIVRILRDPFQATTIAGQLLVEKEKARNSAAEPARCCSVCCSIRLSPTPRC